MVMDVARTSMIHAAAPHFLWPFAVQYAAHQINLQPRVSLPETTPTLTWRGKVGDASSFRVWGSRAFVHNTSADKLSSRAVPCVFLGFPPDAPGWQFYHPTSRHVLSSQDVTFDESVSYYHLYPYRAASLPPLVGATLRFAFGLLSVCMHACVHGMFRDPSWFGTVWHCSTSLYLGSWEPLGAVSTMAGPEERGCRGAGGSGEAQAQGQPRDSAMAPMQPSLGPPRDEPRVFGLDNFNGDNFAEWSFKMENIFDHYDLLEVMEGTEKRPENDPEKSPWVRKSAQGYLLLGQALGSSQICHIKPFQREPEKGPKAWAALKGVHAPATAAVAVVLERQMAALRIEEDEAVEEGVQKFFDLLMRLEGADLNYSELQKKTKLLALLPESWSSLIINLNRDLPRLSLEDVKRSILQEDFRRRELASADGAGAASIGRGGAGGGRGRGRGGRGGRGGGAASMKSAGNESKSRDDSFPGQFFFVSTQAPAGPEKDEGFEEPAAVGKVTLHSLDYWVIDSGATYSMTPRADLLTELEPSPVKHVTSALGQRAEVKGMGKAKFKGAGGKMVGLKNVLWVPNLAANLISVRRLQKAGMDTSSKGAKTYTARLGERILWDLHEDRDVYNETWQILVVPMPKERQVAASISTKGEAVGSGDGANGRTKEIESKKCNLGGTSNIGEHEESGAAAKEQHKGDENPKAVVEEEYGESMWGTIASAAFSNPTSATGECDWLTLHRRMGHVALPILQQLVKNEMAAGIRVKGEPDEVLGCPTCMQAKFTRYPFSSSEATAKAPLDEVVMDVVGPLKLGAAGAEYFLTIVDVYTRMTWVYVLSKKSDVAETVKTDWLPMVERQQDRLVKAIRTDRGGEFLSKEFGSWLKKNGIRHSLTMPYSLAMNGIAERANRTITETARGLLIEAGLPDYFRPDAVRSACMAKNRALTHVGADKWVPYVEWIGRKPKVDMLRMFGCMCMALVPKYLRHNKLGAKAIWAVHLGMAQNSKGWLLWDPFTKKFLVSRDCKFMESLMYKDWKAENEAKIGMRFGEVKSSGLEHVEVPLELSSSSTTTRQSSLVNGGEEAKDAEEEEEEVQQVSERAPTLPSRTTSAPWIRVTPQQCQGLHVHAAEEEGSCKRRIQAPNRLTYDALGRPAKSALAGAALMVGDDEESDNDECAFVFFSPVEMPGEPATLKEALESSDAEEWKKAMESELKSIEENGTWELVELPEGRKAITSKWLFKIKSDADGNIERYKSRLVTKGYQQREKVDYKELFAPVVKPTTLRTLLAVPGTSPVDPLPPQGPAPSGVTQVDPAEPVEVAVDSCAARGAEPGGADSGGAASWGAELACAEFGGSPGVLLRREPLSPPRLHEWYARRCRRATSATSTGAAGPGGVRTGGTGAAGAAGDAAGAGAAGGAAVARASGGAAGAGAIGGAAGTGAALGAAGAGAAGGAAGVAATGGAAGAGATGGAAGAGATGGAAGAGGAGAAGGDAGAGGPGGAAGAGAAGAAGGGSGAVSAFSGGAARPRPSYVLLLQQSFPYSGPTRGLTERREPESRPVSLLSRAASPVRTARAGRVLRPRPPPVPCTHSMTLRPSTAPQSVPLPSPLASSLPDGPDPESDSLRAASPFVTRFLATAVSDPLFESTAASALVAQLVNFAAACRLDYATSLVAESASASVCPPSIGGECSLGTDILEDTQEEFECFVAAIPHLVSMLLASEGYPDAPDIPTPRSYAEAIEGPYSSQWQAAMDAEMASWMSTGTSVDEVPPPGANIVSGMWIFRGVDFFQTFSPTPKMTTLRVLLHVAAQRDYELHLLDFSTAFLQGSLHEEIWLRRPPGFTGTTLATLGFAPSTADPSLFLRTDTTLPLFYVLVYVDNLVFATADTEALAYVKSELQKRHTCIDLGECYSLEST
ncbi:unnamed protein product [Closterium sp. NIES-53]